MRVQTRTLATNELNRAFVYVANHNPSPTQFATALRAIVPTGRELCSLPGHAFGFIDLNVAG